MLEHNRFNVSEDINVFDSLREWIICHYLYFPRMNFIFQPKVSDGCHDMTQKSMGFNGNTIVTVKRHSYRINFWFMAENEVVTRMKNADLSEKKLTSIIMKKYLFVPEISNNTTKTMIEQQSIMNETKKKKI